MLKSYLTCHINISENVVQQNVHMIIDGNSIWIIQQFILQQSITNST